MNQQGLSLTEVLVSLFIVSCTGLLFLKQHWNIEQLYQQMSLKQQALFLLDDVSEKRLTRGFSFLIPQPFNLTVSPRAKMQSQLQMNWPQTKSPLKRDWF